MFKDSDFAGGSTGFERTPPRVPGFKLLRWIGGGSYGDVWLGQDVLGQWRAVKTVHRARFPDDEPYEREWRGIKAYAEIAGEEARLLRVYHAGREDAQGYFYYAMELADPAEPPFSPETYEARTLKRELGHATRRSSRHEEASPRTADRPGPQRLRDLEAPENHQTVEPTDPLRAETARGPADGERHRLPFKQCLLIAREVATALGHLHRRGLVHRDVKPSNIVFIRGEAKLADIGLVAKMEMSLSQVGAAHYLPQEGAGTPQGDFYALGKVLYEMCTGLPVEKFPALPILNKIPKPERKGVRELNQIVLKACNVIPTRRYQSAEQFIHDLDYVDEGSSLRALRWMKRAAWGAAALVVVLAVALVVVRSWALSRERESSLQFIRFISEAQNQRTGVRKANWSTDNWQLLTKAGKLYFNNELRNQAAATLAGIDVHLVAAFTNVGGSSLAFDARGRLLVGGLSNAPGHVWDFQSPNRLAELPEDGDGPVCSAPDGSMLRFVPLPPGSFVLRDALSGQIRREFKLPGNPNAGDNNHPVLAISPDGSRVAAAVKRDKENGTFLVWNATTGEEILRADKLVSLLAFSPDAMWLAAGTSLLPGIENDSVTLYDLRDKTDPLKSEFSGGRAAIRSIAFGSNLLAAGDGGGTITVWEIRGGETKSVCRGAAYDVQSVAFNPDGTLLTSAGRGPPRLWDAATGQPILQISPGPDNARAAAFSPDGSHLAVVAERLWGDPSLLIFGVDADRGIVTLRGLRAQVSKVWWSSDGKHIAGLAHDWTLAVWGAPSGRLVHLFEVPRGEMADNAAFAFFPDGRRFAYVSGTEMRLLNDNFPWGMEGAWPVPRGLADNLRYVDEGKLLLLRREAATNQAGLNRWRLRNLLGPRAGEIVFEQQETNWWAYNMALPPKGDLFFVWNYRGKNGATGSTLRAFSVRDGTNRWNLPTSAEQADFYCDPNGEFGGFNDGTHFSWIRLSDGQVETRKETHTAHAVAPGRKRTAEGGGDQGGCILHGMGLPPEGIRLAMDSRMAGFPQFSPDGSKLAWGTEEGTVLVADIDEVLRKLKELRGGR